MSDFTGPGFYDDVPEDVYHSGKFGPAEGSLSVSGAKVLLNAPALFRWQQDNPVHKDVFDVGSAAHKLVLGVGAELVVVDADSWRTKEAKAAKEAAHADGKTPLLVADHQRVQDMADALSTHRLAMRLLSEGRPEVSAYALDEETGVWRRGRFDWLHPALLVDYKTSVTADPREIAGRYGVIKKFSYDLQADWYLRLARDLGHPAQAFAFLVQMKEPPYLVSVVTVPEDELYDARRRNQQALEMFRDCNESGLWPGYLPDDTCAAVSLTQQTYQEETVA